MKSKQKHAHFRHSKTKGQNKRAEQPAFTNQKRKQKEASKHTVGGF